MISTSLELPITIGTYARIVKPASIEGDLNLFTWTCIMHVTGQPFGDAGEFIERVEFTLHKSFPNHIRNVTGAPFAISADGWGEFPIHIQIVPRVGSSVKCVHYLKLDSVKDVVVNETFDYITLPEFPTRLNRLPPLPACNIPVFSDYIGDTAYLNFQECEDNFIASNQGIRQKHTESVSELLIRAFEVELEFLTLMNKQKS